MFDRKMEDNIHRIHDLDQKIYRIFSYGRFQEMFGNKELVLLNPSKWDDPFENFFLKTEVDCGGGEIATLEALARDWYGQCWTTQSDSDAMWRIYSPEKEKNGIRVSTTIRKLFTAIWDAADDSAYLKFFIGKVEYLTKADIIAFLNKTSFSSITMGGTNDLFSQLLLVKRTEFSHENEIRIIVDDVDKLIGDHRSKTYKIAIDPHTLFDEVCIDPRTTVFEFESLKTQVKAIGITLPIVHSQLYTMTLPRIRM
jgi:hypothetical protein